MNWTASCPISANVAETVTLGLLSRLTGRL
jgi:hypothetical protein